MSEKGINSTGLARILDRIKANFALKTHSHTASDVGAVPTTRTVNSKALSSNISLTASDVGAASSSHTHGNVQNGGTLQTSDITIASGDKLVVTDSSDSSKIARASISFDGSTTTQALTKKGTWGTFLTSAPVTSVNGYTGAVSLTIPTIVKTTATLSASYWNSTSKTQSVTVSGVTSSNTVIVTPAPADIATWAAGGVRCTAQASNSLTFTADTNPTAAITVNVVILS